MNGEELAEERGAREEGCTSVGLSALNEDSFTVKELVCWKFVVLVDCERARISSILRPGPGFSMINIVAVRRPLTTTSQVPSFCWRFNWIVSPLSILCTLNHHQGLIRGLQAGRRVGGGKIRDEPKGRFAVKVALAAICCARADGVDFPTNVEEGSDLGLPLKAMLIVPSRSVLDQVSDESVTY